MTPVPAPERKASVDVREAARLLGVSRKTVRREIKRGRLEAFNVGRAVRISRAELARYSTANRKQAAAS